MSDSDRSGFQEIALLASRIQKDHDLAELLGNGDPQAFDTVMRAAQFPLVTWQPFGKWGDMRYGGYQGNQPCQMGPIKLRSRHRWLVCGNRTGKTEYGIFEDAADVLGIDLLTKGPSRRFKPPIHVWVVSETEDASIEIAQKKMADEVLGEDQTSFGWQLVDDATHYNARTGFTGNTLLFTNGSRIDFKYSAAQRSNKNAFAGRKIHKVHFDEEPYLEVYKECYARTIDYEGELLGTMTPIYDKNHGLPWVYNELYLPRRRKNISFFNWSLYDNPHLSQAGKDALIEEWEEDEIDARVHGMFVPVGMDLAFKRDLIRSARIHVRQPRAGHLQRSGDGKLEFLEDAA